MTQSADAERVTHVMPDRLSAFCESTCREAGLNDRAAAITASLLVTTDAWGHFSHGTIALGQYLRRVRHGGISASGSASIVAEGPSWAILDGDREMAAAAGHQAMTLAVEKAAQTGVAYIFAYVFLREMPESLVDA